MHRWLIPSLSAQPVQEEGLGGTGETLDPSEVNGGRVWDIAKPVAVHRPQTDGRLGVQHNVALASQKLHGFRAIIDRDLMGRVRGDDRRHGSNSRFSMKACEGILSNNIDTVNPSY
jgi:hypothetical protein